MKLFKYLNRIINERENTMNKFFETIYFEYKDDVYRLALSYTHNSMMLKILRKEHLSKSIKT